jgi:hypothetical protein
MIKCTYLMKRLITPNNVILPFSCTYFNFPWRKPSQQIFGSKPVLWVLNTEHSLRQSRIVIIIIIIIILSIEFSSEHSWWNCSPCKNRSLLVAYDCTVDLSVEIPAEQWMGPWITTQFPEWFGLFERATYVTQVRLVALSPVFSSQSLLCTP